MSETNGNSDTQQATDPLDEAETMLAAAEKFYSRDQYADGELAASIAQGWALLAIADAIRGVSA